MNTLNLHAAAAAAALMAASLPVVATPAADVVRSPVPDPRPVMLAALEAPDGKAHGVLTGKLADAITRRFEASSPITIDVSTEKRYRQPGCARLKVLFRQEGVKLPEAATARTQTIEFGINYCLDGLPPRSLD